MLQLIGDNLKNYKIARSIIENSPLGKIYVDTYHYMNRYITVAHQQRKGRSSIINGYYGYAICNPEDEFNRKTGESLSLGRLLKQTSPRFSFTADQMAQQQIDHLYQQHLRKHLRKIQEGVFKISGDDIFLDSVISWAKKSHKKNTNHVVKNHFPPM